MDYFVIEVPDMNDSVVKVSLQSRLYQLRFTWNDTGGYWMLGVMERHCYSVSRWSRSFRSICCSAGMICPAASSLS